MKLQGLPIGGLTSLAGYMYSSTSPVIPPYAVPQLKTPQLNPNMPLLCPPMPIIKAVPKFSANVS